VNTADEKNALEQAAAEWVVRRDAGLTPGQQAELDRWLAADPRHAAALAEMDTAMGVLTRPRALGRGPEAARALLDGYPARSQSRRSPGKFVRAGLGLAAAFLFGVLWLHPPESEPPAPGVATMFPRPEVQHLPDGSVVELNANAEIEVNYTADRRGVRLLRGEALFEVRKDPARPFVVTGGNVEVCAVGTAFVVRLDPTNVAVMVTDGHVTVGRTGPPSAAAGGAAPRPRSPPVLVAAGGRVAVPTDDLETSTPEVEPLTPRQITTALAWREMRFEFTNTALAEAVGLFNRKSTTKLLLGDSALANYRVSGIYWADNPDGFAKLIESTFDIRTERSGPDRITLRRR
jgi:transmembrane sensor